MSAAQIIFLRLRSQINTTSGIALLGFNPFAEDLLSLPLLSVRFHTFAWSGFWCWSVSSGCIAVGALQSVLSLQRAFVDWFLRSSWGKATNIPDGICIQWEGTAQVPHRRLGSVSRGVFIVARIRHEFDWPWYVVGETGALLSGWVCFTNVRDAAGWSFFGNDSLACCCTSCCRARRGRWSRSVDTQCL